MHALASQMRMGAPDAWDPKVWTSRQEMATRDQTTSSRSTSDRLETPAHAGGDQETSP